MGNGYVPGRLDDMAQMRAMIEGILGRLSELEKPMGGLNQFPVLSTAIDAWADTFAIPTTDTQVVSLTVKVPTGYTTAIVTCLGPFEFANNNATPAVVQGYIDLISSTGTWAGQDPGFDMQTPATATMTMTCALGAVVTGMSPAAGQTLTLSGHVLSGTAITSNAFNAFALVGTVIFTA